MIGKVVSHYRIIDKIGQGGMGVVYKAEDTTLHRTVALKFLPSHLVGSTEEMARFIQEARAAAALSHPNICTVYEIDEKGETPFIAMEYIEGKNLDDVMAGSPMPLDDALRYASQVGRGLEEAHAKGVVHRDIKGSNVIVSDKGHAIVMDFGLAKLQGQTKLTREGTTLGTASYMSPEQARGDEVDRRSDIWSLGVVLYKMIAGRYPFAGEHQSALMYSIMNEPHEPLTALRTGVPFDLERIVDKALAKDPAERYQTVSDMIVDMKAVRNQLGGGKKDSSSVVRPASPAPRRKWLIPAIAAGVVISGAIVWWQFAGERGESTTRPTAASDDRVTIAVLPLDNMSGDDSQEYVADGMTEALIAELAKIHALRVTSRTSVMRFKKTTKSIPEVAEILGVATIIEGSVVKSGDRVRVTAQLIDTKTDEHLWAQSYERDMSDVLALQSEVARAIANEVRVELTPEENVRLASASSIDPRAYDLYMRGRYHWNRRTGADLRQALDLFQQAIDIQPDWALGYAALAQTNLVMGSWSELPPEVAYVRGRELAEKAIELDPNQGSAWAGLGGVEAEWDWDWEKAEEYFRKAIDLEPSNASAHQWYGEFLCGLGRFDESLEQIRLARQLDPLSLIIQVVEAWAIYYMGDERGAIAEAEQVLEADSTFTGVYMVLANACRYAGQEQRAVDAYARYYATWAPDVDRALRNAYASGGMEAVTRTIIGGLHQASKAGYVSPADIGIQFASIGEADSAMFWFEKAYEQRANPLQFMAIEPPCQPIRNDPRFQDLLKRLKLDHVKPGYARD